MDSSDDYLLRKLRKDITEHDLQIQAIIQDINNCSGPLTELYGLNSAGRSKISSLRKFIDKFSEISKERKSNGLLKDLNYFRENLASTMEAFKKANIKSMLAIETASKEELMKPKNEENCLRQRQKHDKDNMVKVSSNITEQLLSISRQLADTTKKSAETLDTLVMSSDSVVGTQEELKVTQNTIGQSGKLLAKYGRREFTDKVLMFFAFIFFVACVFYIVQKRLF